MPAAPLPTKTMHDLQTPAVSIIMPVFNASNFLSEAVKSVLAQDLEEPWELLIIDDGSTDGSLPLAQHLAHLHPACIRVLCHAGHVNLGTSTSRNLGIAEASAPVLAFLDADDVWLPDMLRLQLALLRRFPQAAMVYANAERAWDLSLPVALHHGGTGSRNELPPLLPANARAGLLQSPDPLPWFLEDETFTPCTCTVLVRTEIARRVGGFDESFQGLFDDQVFYAKIAMDHPVAVANRCVARYRRHPGSCCVQAWDDAAAQSAARRRFESWLAAYGAEQWLTTAG